MRINLPNQITLVRFVLAVVFFCLLVRFEWSAREQTVWMIDVGLVIFIVAGLSDILDGWLARRQNQVTSLGRVLDPFVDKVLVCGAFVLLLGRNFVDARNHNVSGIEAWMVVIILGRELLVTGLRGFSESQGKTYGANVFGKIKMLVQSCTVGWILLSVSHGQHWSLWMAARHWWIWGTVLITSLSLVAYLLNARDILADSSRR